MIPNVTCERCHGPGRAHVEAARREDRDSEFSLPFGHGHGRLRSSCGFVGTAIVIPTAPVRIRSAAVIRSWPAFNRSGFPFPAATERARGRSVA